MRKNKAIFGLLGLTAVCVGVGVFLGMKKKKEE